MVSSVYYFLLFEIVTWKVYLALAEKVLLLYLGTADNYLDFFLLPVISAVIILAGGSCG